MTPFVLSIIIPTFNRATQLTLLLEDIEAVLVSHGETVQVVVCDNHSTDATSTVVAAFASRWPNAVKSITRQVNIGMEGNIACSMLEGEGKYIWMLSDHQRVCAAEVQPALLLMKSLEFDVAHAKILQWDGVLDRCDVITTWETMSPRRRGAMLFAMSNLSTLVVRNEFAQSAAKDIFRSCVWGFPHLGILSCFHSTTRFVEFGSMSSFPGPAVGVKLVHHYDKIYVRYRSCIDCITVLCRNARIEFDVRGFFTAAYRRSFRGDTLQFLEQPEVRRAEAIRKLCPVIAVNPWELKMIGLIALVSIVLMPRSIRLAATAVARDVLNSRRQKILGGT